eukprot:maker-scaffold711_size108467-snap-gene-0.24 protein:Tk04239 transcript:maker-scaffold711_size108467-snap-gene-0.24-mRNA-1 annotation:"e3 ubiquitin-protein ligase shprh"
MPRPKPSTPQRLGSAARQAQQWRMGEERERSAGPALTLQDLDSGSDEEDGEFVPPAGLSPAERSPERSPERPARAVRVIPEGSARRTATVGTDTWSVALTSEPPDPSVWRATLECLTFQCRADGRSLDRSGRLTVFDGPGPDFGQLELESSAGTEPRVLTVLSGPVEAHLWRALAEVGHKRLCLSRQLAVDSYEARTGQLVLSLFVTQDTLFKPGHPSDVVTQVPRSVKTLLDHCWGLDSLDTFRELEDMKHDIDQIYAEIKAAHARDPVPNAELDPQHPSLIPRLRPYQRNAVRWMVAREARTGPVADPPLHPLYRSVQTPAGESLYYNQKGGFLVKDRPQAMVQPLGGILADEMGLGKTVEVLSLMLCHPRAAVPQPERQEPIFLDHLSKKKSRRRRRSPTPVEFVLADADDVMQIDGNASDSTFSEDADSNQAGEESDVEEYNPRPSRSRGKSKADTPALSQVAKTPKRENKSLPSASNKGAQAFDPHSVLKGRKVTKKSPMNDLILHGVIAIAQGSEGASIYALKKHLAQNFEKSSPQHLSQFRKGIVKLVSLGLLINTSHQKGASGSFVINPDFEGFDSRGIFADQQTLDDVDQSIERVITQRCYEGKPFDKAEAEKQASEHKKPKKESSTYKRLKDHYDMQLAGLSEACELTETYRKARRRWNGSFFDTKVERGEYFECICGTELDADEDVRHRIQCSSCQLWQHSECVKFNVADPFRGNYLCPHCWTTQAPLPSGATLIVSPSTISYQWIEEIQKHIRHKKVRMLFYEGAKQAGYIQPRDLANYDIVITSYTVLQSETNYVDLPHSNSSEGRRFRNAKRYMAQSVKFNVADPFRGNYLCPHCWTTQAPLPSGATLIVSPSTISYQWIEEIQKHIRHKKVRMLFYEGAKQAGYIQPRDLANYDIVITSYTVLQSETNYVDLPHSNSSEGRRFRNAKRYMAIPSPLTSIEWWRICLDEAQMIEVTTTKTSEMALRLAGVNRWCVTGTPMEKSLNDVQGLLLFLQYDPYSLLQWWRECLYTPFCHGIRQPMLDVLAQILWRTCKKDVLNQIDIPPQTDEVLEQMTKKVIVECEDSHRQVVSSLNGLAAIAIIEENWAEAVDTYRDVLRLSEEHKVHVKTDTLQRLHTITNLKEVLDARHEAIAPTLRDDQLQDEATELKKKYLTKYTTAMGAAQDALAPVSVSIVQIQEEFCCRKEPWYVQVLNRSSSVGNQEKLMDSVREEMAQFFDVVNDREFRQIEQKYPNSSMILYKIGEKVTEIDSARENVVKKVQVLKESPPETFLNGAVDCHLRMSATSQKNKKKCELCLVHEHIEAYEGILFHFVKDEIRHLKGSVRQAITETESKKLEEAGVFLLDDQRKGTWADCEAQRLLRAISKFARHKGDNFASDILDDMNRHQKLFEAMKKEFRFLRILWRQIYDLVAGVDELNMSVLRLRLRFEDEPSTSQNSLKQRKTNHHGTDLATRQKDRFESIYILEKHELPAQKLNLISDCTVAKSQFRKVHGQLLYLENLKNSDYGKKGGANPELCPICRSELGMKWSVLQCGHCFCIDCVKVLAEGIHGESHHIRKTLKCPICRSITHQAEISYVSTEVEGVNSDEERKALDQVKGSLSTKMEAVVRTIMAIQADDPESKSLVFSTWPDVLDILGSALSENDIPYASLTEQAKFKRNLQKFKNRQDVKVLLLPISSVVTTTRAWKEAATVPKKACSP